MFSWIGYEKNKLELSPNHQSIKNAISYFKTQLAKKDIARVGPPGPNQYEKEARQIVNNLVDEGLKAGKAGDLPNLDFMNPRIKIE